MCYGLWSGLSVGCFVKELCRLLPLYQIKHHHPLTTCPIETLSMLSDHNPQPVLDVITFLIVLTTDLPGTTTGILDRIFIFVVSDPSILPIWPLLIAL